MMSPCLCKARTAFILMFMVGIISPAMLFAEGQKENRMPEAVGLYDKQEYTKALAILAEIMRTNPDQKSEAQYYIDLIMRQTEQKKNELYQQILTALYEENNIEKTVMLVDELKSTDPATRDIISEIDRGTRIVYNLILFNKLMDEAYALLEQRNYSGAIVKYNTGFELHRAEFFENKAYGNIVLTAVQGLLGEVNRFLVQYASNVQKTERDAGRLASLLDSGQTAEAAAQAAVLHADLSVLLANRRDLRRIGREIKSQNEKLKTATGTGKGDNFLFYAYQVVLGRVDSRKEEGLFLVVERTWEGLLLKADPAMKKSADELFASALSSMRSGDRQKSRTVFAQAGRMYLAASKIIGEYMGLMDGESAQSLSQKAKTIAQNRFPAYRYYVQRAVESRKYPELLTHQDTYAGLARTRDQAGGVAEQSVLAKLRTDIFVETQALSRDEKFCREVLAGFEGAAAAGMTFAESTDSAKELLTSVSSLLADYYKLDLSAAGRIAELEYQPLEKLVADRETRYKDAVVLRGNPGVEDDKSKYPTRAMTVYLALNNELPGISNQLAAYKIRWRSEAGSISTQPGVVALVEKTGSLEARVAVLKTSLDTSLPASEIKATQEQQYTASKLREQGMSEYRLARDAFARFDYGVSSEKGSRTVEIFRQSLLYEEDAGIRSLLGNELPILIKASDVGSTEKILAQKKKAIDDAQRLYSLTQFDNAERILQAAQIEYQKLRLGNDTELEFWLTTVQNARSFQMTREIPKNDSRYNDMTNALNFAQEAYVRGVALQRENKPEEARQAFQSALDKISMIRFDFPYHRESGVLRLKVLIVMDPAQAKRDIDSIFQNALKSNDQKKKLADLEDLNTVVPEYPGLKTELAKAGIGFYRVQEIDPEKVIESNRLYNDALKNFNTGRNTNNRDLLELAYTQLVRALELDPTNQRASALKAQIEPMIRLNPPLGGNDLAIYNRALQAYQQGNKLDARRILAPLYQRMPNHPAVKELWIRTWS